MVWRGAREVCLVCIGVALSSVYACSSSTRDFTASMGTGGADDGAGAKPEAPNAGTTNGGEPSELGGAGREGQGGMPGTGGTESGGTESGGAGGEGCGTCGSECANGEKSCDPLGLGLRTCDASGQWGAPVPCTGLACPVGANSCQGTATCPKAKPTPGTGCGSVDLLCAYGSTGCGCLGGDSGAEWSCSTPFTCAPDCFNQSCVGANAMCTTESGRCKAVTCNSDADCCGLTACDNVTDRCSKGKSPYFTCADGQCTRAATDYDGVCKTLEPAITIESTCEMPCPPTLPANGKRCMPYQQSCDYVSKSCTCAYKGSSFVWDCVSL